MIRRACVWVLIAFILSVSVALADEPTTLAAYEHAVEQALALVERAATEQNSAQRQSWVDQATSQLSAIHTVQAVSGEQWSINNDSLLADLKAAATTEQLQNVAARLRSLQAALVIPPDAAKESDRAKLRDILNQPPFQTVGLDNPLNRLFNQIFEWLDQLFSNTARGVFSARDVIAIVGFIFVVGVLIFFLRTLVSNWVAESQLPASPPGVDLNSGTALAQAQQLANQGDYRTAIRQLYLATLLLLDERGMLRYDRTLTNREYLNAVKDEPKVVSTLEPIVDTFDRTWYGFESVDPEDFETYRKQVETLKEL